MADCKKLLIYLMRRDLRVADNPILHELAKSKKHGFTHLLPLYIFSAQQIEVSGFIQSEEKSPYPEARSRIGGFWRCGPHRAKFIAESIWDVKGELEKTGSGLCIRVGMIRDVIKDLLAKFASENVKVGAIWMVGDYGYEELEEEAAVKSVCKDSKVGFRLWTDEKYLIDDRDIPYNNIREIPDIFTSYRKSVEPLRVNPRGVLVAPTHGSLPAYPDPDHIPPQFSPFSIPTTLESINDALLKPLKAHELIKNPPEFPPNAKSSFPLKGGCSRAQDRLNHLLLSSSITTYHDTRNGLLGVDYSTKLSAYLALGCITSRQIHHALLSLEEGTDSSLSSVLGYGAGENEGTKATRFELLWRDYMRLCAQKFSNRLFRASGFRNKGGNAPQWNSPATPARGNTRAEVQEKVDRFLNGTTGMGLIDAAMRELFLTGFTSNRTRQNVASFFAKHLGLDWRIGAEWYESMLTDYDLASNWGNWQYVAGVGNDPRGEDRVFNPVKQAFDYDPKGEYIMTWCPELRGKGLQPGEIFQSWTVKESQRDALGLKGLIGVEKPLRTIQFTFGGRGRGPPRNQDQRQSDRGGKTGGRGKTSQSRNNGGGYGGYGYGSTRGGVYLG
ncbi:putative cryptochrome [Podosphaera aphanis]|nr:putative cryptochrome [Podosphaera aphanis]